MEPGFSAAGTFFAGQRTLEDVVVRSVARQAGSSLAGIGLALATRGVAQAADIALDRTMAALGKGNPNINIPPPAEHATISAYKPGYWNRQRDGNFVQRLWYETADNAMVWGKSMLFGRQNVAHLGGGRVTERDAVQAIAGTASLFIPEAKAETAVEEAIARETVSGAAKTGLQYSDDLVKAAQKLYPNKASKIELYHITPKYLGGAKNGPLVPLDASYHQVITNEFRAIHGYGLPKPSPQRLQEIMQQVYSKYPLPPGY